MDIRIRNDMLQLSKKVTIENRLKKTTKPDKTPKQREKYRIIFNKSRGYVRKNALSQILIYALIVTAKSCKKEYGYI